MSSDPVLATMARFVVQDLERGEQEAAAWARLEEAFAKDMPVTPVFTRQEWPQ